MKQLVSSIRNRILRVDESNLVASTWITSAIVLSVVVGYFESMQSAILTGTAVLITWYSWETFQLRKEMARQNDLQEMPILNLHFRGDYLELINASSLSAYDIYIDPTHYLDLKLTFHHSDRNLILEPGSEFSNIAIHTHAKDGRTVAVSLDLLRDYLRKSISEKGEENFDKFFVDLIIHFKNMRGRKFIGNYKIIMPDVTSDDLRISLVKIG